MIGGSSIWPWSMLEPVSAPDAGPAPPVPRSAVPQQAETPDHVPTSGRRPALSAVLAEGVDAGPAALRPEAPTAQAWVPPA